MARPVKLRAGAERCEDNFVGILARGPVRPKPAFHPLVPCHPNQYISDIASFRVCDMRAGKERGIVFGMSSYSIAT
eukprot:9119529-Pyramimonas_sp.AAC.1